MNISTLKGMQIQYLTLSVAETLFRDFSMSASNAIREVNDFRNLMQDGETTKVMEQAKKSRAERPTGIKTWRVTEHPDWATKEK